MKKIILTFGILTISLSFANAQGQQVSNSAFTTAIGALNLDINSKNVPGETSSFNQLNGMMNTQITWLTAVVNSARAKQASDMAKANADLTAANKEKAAADSALAKAEAAIDAGNSNKLLQDLKKAEANIILAKNDMNKANQEQASAVAESPIIQSRFDNLASEKRMYSALQPMKNNILVNKTAIISDLNTFASTLQ